jgi:glycosyltransferase involved in cell wall biosynthesis
MKILYLWLTMGEYHIARMKAIQALPDVHLSVVEITNLDDHQWSIDHSELNDYTCLQDGAMLNKRTIKQAKRSLQKYLANQSFDVVVNGAGYAHQIIHRTLTKELDCPVVLWSETMEIDNDNKLWKEWVKKRRVAQYDAAIVAGTEHQAYLEKLGMDGSQIQIVGNVVNNQRFEQNLSVPQQKDLGFLYVGRLLEIKNIDNLIRAYHDYVEKLHHEESEIWALNIVGSGPAEKELKQIAEQGPKSGAINFLGNRQPNEIPNLYHRAQVFVLPSISEPWGLVTNEAMASRLPIIISNHCGSAELVKHGEQGFLFDPNNVQELTGYLLQLHSDRQLREQMSESAYRRIQNYSPQTYASHCYELFEQVVS